MQYDVDSNIIKSEGRVFVEVYDKETGLLRVKMAIPGLGDEKVSIDLMPVGRTSKAVREYLA